MTSAVAEARSPEGIRGSAPWRAPAAVGVLAALLAVAGAWRPSLWTDEAATLTAAQRSLPDLWRMLGTVDAVHGAYYAAMHPWVAVAGGSALALRLPSAFAVGLTAAGLCVLTRRLGGSAWLAVTAGVVVGLLPRTTWMGAEGRSYAATALAAVLLTLVAVSLTQPPGTASRRRWLGYALLAAAAVVLNLYLALLVVAHGVTLLLRGRRDLLPRFVAAAAAAAVLAAPVLVVAAGQSAQLGDDRPDLLRLARGVLVNQTFLGDTPTPTTGASLSPGVADAGGLWQPAAVLLALAGWGVVAVGLVGLARRTPATAPAGTPVRHRAELVGWALPWAFLPPLAVAALALAGPPVYNPRYFSFTAPAVALLLAVGLESLRGRGRLLAATALVLAAAAAPVYVSQRGPTAKSGTDWAQAAAVVHRHRAGEGVYFAPRYPQDAGPVVARTLRSIRIAYPEAFAGLRDVTEISTPEASGTLTGTSARLAASRQRLAGLTGVWVVRRRDYPAALAQQDDAVLLGAGFRRGAVWRGGVTEVTEFHR